MPSPQTRHEKTLLIRPEHLNHDGHLFGGYMMKWADDLAYTTASLAFPGGSFVTKLFGQFDFKAPVMNGDIVKVYGELAETGKSSCKINLWCDNARTGAEVFRTQAVMVNVKNGKATPIAA